MMSSGRSTWLHGRVFRGSRRALGVVRETEATSTPRVSSLWSSSQRRFQSARGLSRVISAGRTGHGAGGETVRRESRAHHMTHRTESERGDQVRWLTDVLAANSELWRRYSDFVAAAEASRQHGCIRHTNPLSDEVVFNLEVLVAAVDAYQVATRGTRPEGRRTFGARPRCSLDSRCLCSPTPCSRGNRSNSSAVSLSTSSNNRTRRCTIALSARRIEHLTPGR